MKKKLLIIRSVSFQQLDSNIRALKEHFPSEAYDYWILTHAHGVAVAKNYPDIVKVVDYGTRRNFTFFHLPKEIRREYFSIVITPVTNITGVGFANVKLLALRCRAEKIVQCNLVSELKPLSHISLWLQTPLSILFGCIAFPGAVLLAAAAPFIILIGCMCRKCPTGGKQPK